MPPQLRQRTAAVKPGTYASTPQKWQIMDWTSEEEKPSKSTHKTVKTFQISLSDPPSTRYREAAEHYRHLIQELPPLFDEVVGSLGLPLPTWPFHFLAWLFLRRLYSSEQTAELQGMSAIFGIPLYLLIAYNVFLDLLMGCTSGGIVTQDAANSTTRMMHFRSLDWGMPLLRKAIVRLDYVDGPEKKKLATSIGYAGYVGILTGVREGLSVSLNFRPYHHAHGWSWENVKFYMHLLLVLLGLRPSISAVLRDFVLPRNNTREDYIIITREDTRNDYPRPAYYTIDDISEKLCNMPTTAAYLTFCTGNETIILEKDFRKATVLCSPTFIAVTNHDTAFETSSSSSSSSNEKSTLKDEEQNHTSLLRAGIGMQDLLDESMERKMCLTRKWEEWVQEQERAATRSRASTKQTKKTGIKISMLREWMLDYPVANEETHFMCILDPTRGKVDYVTAFEEGDIRGVEWGVVSRFDHRLT